MVNSRTLKFLPIENEIVQVLVITPNGNKPFGKPSYDKDVLVNKWRKSQQFTERFHQHFTKVCLDEGRNGFNQKQLMKLKVGNIILVVEENIRPDKPKGPG